MLPPEAPAQAVRSRTAKGGQFVWRWPSASPLREKLRNLLRRNRALTEDFPAGLFVREIHDGGSDFAGRRAAVDDDGNTHPKLVAHRHRRRAFGFAAEVG